MQIDLAPVDLAYVAVLTGICFIAALLGSLISFRNKLGGAILAAVLFAVGLVAWMYYPHPQLPGPLTPRTVGEPAHGAAAPVPSPVRPSNPVSTVSPPGNPVETVTPPAPVAPAPVTPAPSGH